MSGTTVPSAVQTITLTQIAFEDHTFLHTYPARAPEALVRSVRQLGVVQPLVLQRLPSGRFRVVAGFRRLWAARELGLTTVPAQLLPSDDTDEAKILRWAASENAGHRQLNRVEVALVLKKLRELDALTVDELVAFSFSIGGPKTEEQVKRLIHLLNLEPGFLDLAAENRLSDDTVDGLLRLTSEDRQAVLQVVETLHLSLSRLRELVRYGSDIARRDGKSLAEILSQPIFSSVLQHDRLSPAQKTERFFLQLRALRYPGLAVAEERFQRLQRELQLPPRSRLLHSPSFETQELTLELRFAGPRQFRQTVQVLKHLGESPKLEALFRFLELTPTNEPDNS